MRPYLIISTIVLSLNFATGQSIRQIGQDLYWAGIPKIEFDGLNTRSFNKGKQLKSNWYWAACIQMVLNYHGLSVNQTQVVAKLFQGRYYNATATEEDILKTLNSWAINKEGQRIRIYAKSDHFSVNTLIKTLVDKYPLIVGMEHQQGGPTMVLTQIIYKVEEGGALLPLKVYLEDPWPQNHHMVEMDWEAFQSQCTTAVRTWVY